MFPLTFVPSEKKTTGNMKKSVLTFVWLAVAACAAAEEKKVAGPDGKLAVYVDLAEGGKPVYRVDYNGEAFLDVSPLGLNTNVGDFTQGLSLKGTEARRVSERYSVPAGKRSEVHYEANEQVFRYERDGKAAIDIVFRISNHDVAFRYKVWPQGDSLCAVVKEEATGFVLPEGSTTFLCPQSGPMGGFARTSPSYETDYTADDAPGKNGWGEGYTFPCLFRTGGKGWVLVSETGVDSRYCASRLMGGKGQTYTIGFPQEGEWNGNGTVCPGIMLPGETPWRTVTVGTTLAPIVETTVAFDVVEPVYAPSRPYEYGRGTWSWITGLDNSITFETQKRYVDFAAEMGYESVLVDNYWDSRIGRKKIEELARYAAAKGVALYLWYNTNGYWNDAPQGPRGCLDRTPMRHREMAWMRDIGIRGIKVDFMGSDKQVAIKLYEDILCDANEYGLLVIFHGCTLPRGWERMYPNFVSAEAVRASENMRFSQEACDNEAFGACLHPFIRNTVASMDFGGSTLNHFYNMEDETGKGPRRVTSDVFALATAVLFQSAVQHFALTPSNLQTASAWAIDFMKRVPTTWDDVRFIDGYPGQYAILARRHGDTWYVAGVNARNEAVEVKVPLPMFAPGETVESYEDDEKLQGRLTERRVGRDGTMRLYIPRNGGVVLVGKQQIADAGMRE